MLEPDLFPERQSFSVAVEDLIECILLEAYRSSQYEALPSCSVNLRGLNSLPVS